MISELFSGAAASAAAWPSAPTEATDAKAQGDDLGNDLFADLLAGSIAPAIENDDDVSGADTTTVPLAAAFSPGPGVLMAISTAATHGARRALYSSLGNALGVFIVATTAVAGLGLVLKTSALAPFFDNSLKSSSE